MLPPAICITASKPTQFNRVSFLSLIQSTKGESEPDHINNGCPLRRFQSLINAGSIYRIEITNSRQPKELIQNCCVCLFSLLLSKHIVTFLATKLQPSRFQLDFAGYVAVIDRSVWNWNMSRHVPPHQTLWRTKHNPRLKCQGSLPWSSDFRSTFTVFCGDSAVQTH